MSDNCTSMRIERGRVLENDPVVSSRYKLNDIYCNAWVSHAISALCEFKVPDQIDDHPKSAGEIAALCGLHAGTLYRCLRAAASNGVFVEDGNGNFSHNETSRLLRSDHPYSWSGMARMWGHPSAQSAWMHLRYVLKDGRSGMQHSFGKTLYEYLAEYSSATEAFSDAMISNSAHVSHSIAKDFPFKNFKRVMDLGGGAGTLLIAILQHNAHLSGVIFDLPSLESAAIKNIASNQLGRRCSFKAGSFLQEIPADADLFMIKNSLWNWNDQDCVQILKNVRKAIGENPDGRFLLIEYIINSDNKTWSSAYDLQILNLPGGRARTVSEYEMLLKQASLKIENSATIEDQNLLLIQPEEHS